MTRDYPGNVRDLDIVLHEAMAASSDGVLRVTPAMLAPPEPRAAKPTLAKPHTEAEVRSALGRHEGNVTRAADDLRLNRYTLIRLIKKYGLRSAA